MKTYTPIVGATKIATSAAMISRAAPSRMLEERDTS